MTVRKKISNLRFFKSNGFSLPELMVTVGLGVVIVAGLGTLFVNISSVQSSVSTQTQLAQVSARISGALADPAGWGKTVGLASVGGINQYLNCLKSPVPTCVPTGLLPLDKIQDAGDNLIFWNNGSNGFTYQGGNCSGFSTSSPSDSCPFSFNFTVQYSCPKNTSCLTPELTVLGTLLYAPVNPPARPLNLNKYQIRVIKGIGTLRNDAIQITEQTPPKLPPAAAVPSGGTCPAGGVSRRFTNVIQDSACSPIAGSCNVTTTAPQVPKFPIELNAGTYVCFATAEGYAIGKFNISVKVNGTMQNISSPPALASQTPPEPDIASLQNFTISYPGPNPTFQVEIIQNCTAAGTVPPFDLGYPLLFGSGYGTNVYSTLYCTRIL